MVTKPNKRRNVRVYCDAPAKAEGPRGPIKGKCKNLSVGGMFFLGPTLPVGQSVEFLIELSGLGKIRAVGEIRYHHTYDEGTGMGVRFTRLAQEDLAVVNRFIDSQE